MTEGITASGLQVYGYNTLLENLKNNLNTIYATDGNLINFDSETPDGQLVNIFTQCGADVRELAQEIYNSFDPDKCSGVVQDSRYALNYIARNGGTFTIQNIDVTVDRVVVLKGLDGSYNDTNVASYTVSDDAGTLWYLIDSVELQAGTHSLPFRSKNLGFVQSSIGTITNQITKVLGVVSVINNVAPTTLGIEQESDSQFKIRRSRSTAKNGQNNIDALEAQLLDLDGVSDVKTYVNNSFETDRTGTPMMTVWVIVEGGANADIATTIYQNSCGLPTRGDIVVNVPSLSGQIFPVRFDRANPIPLYIKFDMQLTTSPENIDISRIVQYIAENLSYSLDETAESSKITEFASMAILANGGGGYALNVKISTDGVAWTEYIPSLTMQNKFVIDSTRITVSTLE